jgi:hypothetical protein
LLFLQTFLLSASQCNLHKKKKCAAKYDVIDGKSGHQCKCLKVKAAMKVICLPTPSAKPKAKRADKPEQ